MEEIKKLNEPLAKILSTIDYFQFIQKKPTTRDLEQQCYLPRPTFFNNFKIAKKCGLVNSSSNEKHEIVWAVSEKGKQLKGDYINTVLNPREQESRKESIKLFLKQLNKAKIEGKWIDFDGPSINKKYGLDWEAIYYLHTILYRAVIGKTIGKPAPVGIKFKLEKGVIRSSLKEIGLILSDTNPT